MKITKSFFLGIIAALGALVFESALSTIFPKQSTSTSAGLDGLAPLMIIFIMIEEFLKFAIISKSSKELDRKKYIMLNALLIGIGFSTTEAFIVFLNNDSLYQNFFQGIFGIFIIHMFTSGLFGFSVIKKWDKRNILTATSVFLAIISHLAYNGLLIYNAPVSIIYAFLSFLAALMLFSIFMIGKNVFNE